MNILNAIGGLVEDLFDPPLRVRYFESEPEPSDVGAKTFAIVGTPKLRKYAHFRCPCGCGQVIVLTSNPKVRPRWTLVVDRQRRPTVAPSIWRTTGCGSHFFVERGRIKWV